MSKITQFPNGYNSMRRVATDYASRALSYLGGGSHEVVRSDLDHLRCGLDDAEAYLVMALAAVRMELVRHSRKMPKEGR